ncbi:sporulation stage II protein D [Halothermothrix orenii H 168]|uniref:Sporulation stage II protein D n=2 Tax=Halothermothrix orenii TaxID=31909 RepID=B8CZ06_HALOH|nr:sporulation stage II protein D [Halothermothrix orenii H 168]
MYILSLMFIAIVLIVFSIVLLRGLREEEPLVIKVLLHREDRIVKMGMSEYLQGVLAAEMPASYHLEALKAQAVAARTYTLKRITKFGGKQSPEHPGADICTDYRHCQAWISRNQMKGKWGIIPYLYFKNRIKRAVEETRGEVLLYDGRFIDAVYHSNSGGQTEDARHVWGKATPYLISVPSPYDQESQRNYLNDYVMGLDRFNNYLGTDIEPSSGSQNIRDKVKVLSTTLGDRVLKIKIGNKIFTGREVRTRLNLPSSKFTLRFIDEKVLIKVFGKGHGVGMSQDGANGFARHGYNYRKILQHYYPGTKIVKLKELLKK